MDSWKYKRPSPKSEKVHDQHMTSFNDELKLIFKSSALKTMKLFSRDSYYMRPPCFDILSTIKNKTENLEYNTFDEYLEDLIRLRKLSTNDIDVEGYKISEHLLITLKSELSMALYNRIKAEASKKRLIQDDPLVQLKRLKIDAERSNLKMNQNPLHAIDAKDIKCLDAIGYGAYATVYRGYYRCCPVALKCLSQKVSEDDFLREVVLMSNIRHPGFVQYVGYCKEKRWIVMEWMENGSLFNFLHDGYTKLSMTEKLVLIKSIASSMEYLHAHQLRHCDLNSKNLLLDKHLRIKISDLGLTEEIEGDSQTTKKVGTLRWMSPEMVSRKCKSLKMSDVFSFGIVMFEIISDRIPYEELDDQDVRRSITKGIRPSMKGCDEWSKHPQLKKLYEDCTTFDYTARPSFEEIFQRLEGMTYED